VKLIQKIIANFKTHVIRKFNNYGYNIIKIHDIDIKISKLHSIKDRNARLHSTKQLASMYPKNPKVHLELIQCLHTMNDSLQFEQMNKYPKILREWLSHNGLSELRNIEFIWVGYVVGSFGNHFAIKNLLNANKYGLRTPKKIVLLLPENAQLSNPILFSYFEPYISVIRDSEVILAMKSIESYLTLPLGVGLPMDEVCPFLDIAANMAEIERIKLGIEEPLFHLNKEHYDLGKKALKKLGLPDDAWYVTLHVREPGYRGETEKNTAENWRNADPEDYLLACKVITDAGGWVFRMGDPSMTTLPEMPQVIDYAHREDIRSDLMDIFLGATCRFLIGTASGYLDVPGYFGVPIIFTNCSMSTPYFNMTENDLYLPRLLKRKESDKYLSLEEYMSPPLSMLTQHFIEVEGLYWVENTSEEIEAAAIEMLTKTNENNISKSDDDLQIRFKSLAEKCGFKYGGHKVTAFASISHQFIHKHSDLLDEVI
jgi:putative glycosyltransferase (TIGR04372 family)